MSSEELITLAAAAKMIGIGHTTMWRYATQGLIPVLRTPTGTMRIRIADLEQLISTPLNQGRRRRKAA